MLDETRVRLRSFNSQNEAILKCESKLQSKH